MRLLAAVLVLLPAAPCLAGVHSPRVVSEHTADAYSMKTFGEFHCWRDLEGDQLAWAIFEYLTDRRTGLYPMGAGARENETDLYEYGLVRDPVKMINVYCNAYCDVLGPVMAGIWQDMGRGPARTVNLLDWSHVVAEVFYDGGWHYLDLDVRAAFRRPDGSLASLQEAREDASLWGVSGPRFFPLDDPGRVREIYRRTAVHHRHRVHSSGHTMDYVLRPGETFTRWWRPQGGRWLHHPSYNQPHAGRILRREPRGPKSKHPSFTIHTHGNGRFVYAPDLTAGSRDFEDGAYDAQSVRAGAGGLALERDEPGHAIFEVRTPYVIVPLVGVMEDFDDDREASVVQVDGEDVSLAISNDSGITWKSLGDVDGKRTFDLTPLVTGEYGYLLRLQLNGPPASAVVRHLRITTWVQLHPASLPALRRGENRMELRTGDHHGLKTRVVEIRPRAGVREEILKHCAVPPRDYDPQRTTSRIRGPFVVRVEAPPATRIAWLSAGGSFRTLQGDSAPRTANTMAYAVGEPRDFVEFYRAEVPAGNAHWHYNADREVMLDVPAREVFLRYVGDPAVNNVRIYAHCVEDRPARDLPVVVTHGWREDGELKTKTLTLPSAGQYTVNVDGDPTDEYIELSVPSLRAP